jgi:hypothetical protein
MAKPQMSKFPKFPFFGTYSPETFSAENVHFFAENFVKKCTRNYFTFFVENSAEFSTETQFSAEKNVRELDPWG